LKSLP
jgi:hypothetical protein